MHAVGRKNTLRADNESLYCRVLFGVHVSLLRKIHNILVVRVSHNLSQLGGGCLQIVSGVY